MSSKYGFYLAIWFLTCLVFQFYILLLLNLSIFFLFIFKKYIFFNNSYNLIISSWFSNRFVPVGYKNILHDGFARYARLTEIPRQLPGFREYAI